MALKHWYAVIMAGGIGTRFWPYSRQSFPKQFHDILGTGKTLLQQTVERLKQVVPIENIYVVGSQEHEAHFFEQLPDFAPHQFILEPSRRNTAPCIAYSIFKIFQKDKKANLVVSPADHYIANEKEFTKIIQKALKETAQRDILVTLGIQPTRPDTGYGYIQYCEEKTTLWRKVLGISSPFKKVKLFAEKPPLELAIEFLRSGDFLWNSGIFVWNAKTIIREFEKYLPDIYEAFAEIQETFFTEKENKAVEKAYTQCRAISIDYGIMEKSEHVFVIPANIGWSDLGTWKSLYELSAKDDKHNVIKGNVVAIDTESCIIYTPQNRLVIVKGLKDFIVVEHDNALMICPRQEEQSVRDFVNIAEKKGQEFV